MGPGAYSCVVNLSLRTWPDVDPCRAGFAPAVALVVGAIGIANGDMRVDALPLTMTIAVLCLTVWSVGPTILSEIDEEEAWPSFEERTRSPTGSKYRIRTASRRRTSAKILEQM
jgi:hypothetical protein